VATGKPAWKTVTGRQSENDKGNGPRGTPTFDGGKLYAVAADGTLACLDAATGKTLWKTNFVQDFSGRNPRWLYSESPLIEGGMVIVTPGGSGAGVVALDKNTGKVVWKTQSDRAGYSSAMPFDAGSTRGLAVLTQEAAIGLNAKNGELLWRYDKVANRVANIATPIVARGHIFVSTDYGTGCALLKLTPDGGSVKASEVYFNKDMRNHYTTSVLIGDTLYGFSSAILTAMNFMTGEVKWKDRSVGKGNCIYAGNRLYCMGEGGTVGLIDPSPAAYKEVSRFEIPKGGYPTWTPPVVANGRLYLREQDNLYSFDIKK
jgi:outer membrane protein assembly factor BamB